MKGGRVIGPFTVFGWSVSGNETCIGVRKNRTFFVFDVGTAPMWSKSAEHVFISHGHIDHIGGICQHMRKRELNRLSPANYYMHPCLIESVRRLCEEYGKMQGTQLESLHNPNLLPISPGTILNVVDNWTVEAFRTDHVVRSQGYILYEEDYGTKKRVPQIAFTGDTRFSVFTELTNPDLLNVGLLISEATYLDNPERHMPNTVKHGHCHINQYTENAELFSAVGAICLIHFSDRYTASVIDKLVYRNLPHGLASKTFTCLAGKKAQSLTF